MEFNKILIENAEKKKVIFGGVSWPGNKLLNDV